MQVVWAAVRVFVVVRGYAIPVEIDPQPKEGGELQVTVVVVNRVAADRNWHQATGTLKYRDAMLSVEGDNVARARVRTADD